MPAPPRPEEVRADEQARAKHDTEHARLKAALAHYDTDARPARQAEWERVQAPRSPTASVRSRTMACPSTSPRSSASPPSADRRPARAAGGVSPDDRSRVDPTQRGRGRPRQEGAQAAGRPCDDAGREPESAHDSHPDPGRFPPPGGGGPAAHRRRSSRHREATGGFADPARPGPMADRPGQPPDCTRGGQPDLAAPVRPAASSPRSRTSAPGASPPRTPSCSTGWPPSSRAGLEHEGPDPLDRHLGDVPAGVADPARAGRPRSEQRLAGAAESVPARGRRSSATRPWPSPACSSRSSAGRASAHLSQPGISELTYAGSAHWVESTGPDRYRRGLYTWFQRTSPYPMLVTFDAPDANVCAARRERSEHALAGPDAPERRGLRRVCPGPRASDRRGVAPSGPRGADRPRLPARPGAKPTAAEAAGLGRLYETLSRHCRSNPEAAAKLAGPWKAPGVEGPEAAPGWRWRRTILNLDEFVTRE